MYTIERYKNYFSRQDAKVFLGELCAFARVIIDI